MGCKSQPGGGGGGHGVANRAGCSEKHWEEWFSPPLKLLPQPGSAVLRCKRGKCHPHPVAQPCTPPRCPLPRGSWVRGGRAGSWSPGRGRDWSRAVVPVADGSVVGRGVQQAGRGGRPRQVAEQPGFGCAWFEDGLGEVAKPCWEHGADGPFCAGGEMRKRRLTPVQMHHICLLLSHWHRGSFPLRGAA